MLPKPLAVKPAHLLFPAEQVFLWLPGLPGDEVPYCTYNECRGDRSAVEDRWVNGVMLLDERGACYAPPYPVSRETHIMWHTNISPPFPYHAVPLTRSLSHEEIEEIACAVRGLLDVDSQADAASIAILRNDYKSQIQVVLSSLGLLASTHPHGNGDHRMAGSSLAAH
ncbi:MAG: hypothetical protein ABI162_08275 [Luteolibacter sp.]